jgi:hypothetical protein
MSFVILYTPGHLSAFLEVAEGNTSSPARRGAFDRCDSFVNDPLHLLGLHTAVPRSCPPHSVLSCHP